MSAHTPGPWIVERFRSPLYPEKGETLLITSESVSVCSPNHALGAVEANTHLIASAPELLSALYGIAELTRYGEPEANFLNDIRRIAETAIARATGGAT